ncbi:MAG: YcjF family protein [Rhodoferax sp.]
MTLEQQHALLTIALLAAFADDHHDEREREHIRRLVDTLGGQATDPHLAGLYGQVLLKQVNLASVAATLTDPSHRQLAFETAVCVCDADGHTTEAEKTFLENLAQVLHLDAGVTTPLNQQGQAMADLVDAAAPKSTHVAAAAHAVPVAAVPDQAELDRSILNHAILNGALELLPQSWASMAIVPLQIKMVYSIGKAQGYDLDQGHIRDFLATLGVGLTSQYLEQFGRKLLGGLLGQLAGGMGKSLGKATASVAFSFATTYALGQVAKRYYAGGRQMSTALLQETFQGLIEPAKDMQTQYLPQIRQKASGLDMGQIMSMVRAR